MAAPGLIDESASAVTDGIEGMSLMCTEQQLSETVLDGGQLAMLEKFQKQQYRDFEPDFLQGNSEVTIDSERSHFVHTDDMDDAVEALDTHGRVLLCGPPGCGKTTHGHALLRRYRGQGFKPYVIAHVHDWHAHVGEGRRSVVLLDGALGKVRVDWREHSQLQAVVQNILKLSRKGHCLLVLTVYPHILRELRVAGCSSDTLLDSMTLVHMLREPLEDDVKREMLNLHLADLQLDPGQRDALVADILHKDVSGPAFPWCCRQLARRMKSAALSALDEEEEEEDSVPLFTKRLDHAAIFTFPAGAFISLLQALLRDPLKGEVLAAAMALKLKGFRGFLHDRDAIEEELQTLGFCSVSRDSLEEYADRLKGFILNHDSDGFRSRVYYDAVGHALGRSFRLPILLRVCDVTFLVQHVRTKETATEFSITVGSTADDQQLLMQTMYEHMVSGQLVEMCQHPALHCPHFLQQFDAFCRHNKNYVQRLLGAVDTVHNMPLLYWSVWGPSAHLTHWCLALAAEGTLHNVQASSLMQAACACALLKRCSENRDGEWKKTLNKLVRAADKESRDLEAICLPLPCRAQCIQEIFRSAKDALLKAVQTDSLCYLHDPSLLIPSTLLRVQARILDHEGHVKVGSQCWHLVFRLLFDRDVDEADDEGDTLLHVASRAGHVQGVRMAVKSGASLTATNNKGRNPPQLTADRRKQRNKEADSDVIASLFMACRDGDQEGVKVLLCTSVGVHDKDRYGTTALHQASGAGQTDVAALLISLGADVNVKTEICRAPLPALLLKHHYADVNVKDTVGNTPLHVAYRDGHTETALLLIQHHADVNVKDTDGSTPLHDACRDGDTETALLLIQHHADVNVEDTDGWTPLHDACRYGNTETALLLIQHHADVNAKNCVGKTPLDFAFDLKKLDLAELLVQNGATVKRRSRQYRWLRARGIQLPHTV